MIIPASSDLRLNVHGACIRFDDLVNLEPRIHHNTAHACVGIESIEVIDGLLRLHLTKRPDGTAYPIITMMPSFDESMCDLGWTMGLTGGSGYASLQLWKDGVPGSVTDPELYGVNRNIWILFVTLADQPMWEPLPALDGGWSSVGAGIRRDGNLVSLQGEIWGGVLGPTNPIGTLEQRFWPTCRIAVPIPDMWNGTADGVLNVSTAGFLFVTRGNGGPGSPGLSLGGVTWVTEQPNV